MPAGQTKAPPATEPRGPPEGTVRRTTNSDPITLRNDRGVDLDGHSPNWGVTSALPSGGKVIRPFGSSSTDLGWTEENLVFIGDMAVVARGATYSDCASETAYGPEDIPLNAGGAGAGGGAGASDHHLQKGLTVCLITSEQRYAVLIVRRASPRQIDIDITVYDH